MASIDLNCDLGEESGQDPVLMPLISSANIACGAHAGDDATMGQTIDLALRHGVAIGAHPGFDDRAHFGRRELPVAPSEAGRLVLAQTRLLQRIALERGALVTHMKPHGALYNLAARDPAVAMAIAEAILALDPNIRVFGLANSQLIRAARRLGLRVANEAFADRTYREDGTLTPRSCADAMILTEEAVVEQVLRIVREGHVRATAGTHIRIEAQTICLHGDRPSAVEFARRLRHELSAVGITIKPLNS
jgi:5-oxoprolinase (ATP-hydrolysing) subunit A